MAARQRRITGDDTGLHWRYGAGCHCRRLHRRGSGRGVGSDGSVARRRLVAAPRMKFIWIFCVLKPLRLRPPPKPGYCFDAMHTTARRLSPHNPVVLVEPESKVLRYLHLLICAITPSAPPTPFILCHCPTATMLWRESNGTPWLATTWLGMEIGHARTTNAVLTNGFP